MLLKLGLTQKEIANTLGVTTDAIKKAKQHLRKKYKTKIDALLENLNSQETNSL